MEKRRYQPPECEKVMLNVTSALMDENFGNSGPGAPTKGDVTIDENYSNKGGIFDDDYEWENK